MIARTLELAPTFKSFLICSSALLMTSAAQAANLVPHRAVYDLEMVRSGKSSGFSDIKGRMAYELIGSTCEGWSVNFRIANRFSELEGDVKLFDSQSASWESGDGLEMKFDQKEYIDNTLQAEKRVNVSRPSANVDAAGKIAQPEEAEFTLKPDVVFPMVHQGKLLDAAAQGVKRDASMVYDGSDGAKSYRAISFIGTKHNPGTEPLAAKEAKAEVLKSLSSWPMTISYYPGDDASVETPSYQIDFNLYENGVATALTLDYGDFALKGVLTHLEMLQAEPCQ